MSFHVDSNKHQERIIFVIVAHNKIVKGFSDKAMAKNAVQRLRQMDNHPEFILDPIAIKMIDSQALNTKQWERLDTGY